MKNQHMNPAEWYCQRVAEAENALSETKRRILRVSMLRLLLFVAGICGVIYFFHAGAGIIALAACLTFGPFFALVVWHNKLFAQKEWQETKLRLNQNELEGLKGNYGTFGEGKKYVDPQHPYTYDIDVFGPHSLFQMLNRTCTPIGEETLAQWLGSHLTRKTDIEKRQDCIRELARHPEFRETFRITGTLQKGAATDATDIEAWIKDHSGIQNAWWAKALVWGVPAINALLLAGAIAGLIPAGWFGLSFSAFFILSFGFIGRATHVQEKFGKKLKTLSCYARLISITRQTQWQSEEMRELLDRLRVDGHSPTEALNELSKELNRLDLRNNQLLYMILEGCLFFQLRQVMRIEKWKRKYGSHTMGWLHTVGELDALCSLATFAYNHPAYTYPQISDTPFCFVAKNMGHPLMPESQCVKNDVLIPSRPYFLIITGANMAGKSTYLRTIGVNYLLACIGCPVCCDALTLYPARLITSLRTSDSLAGNESYFFAEMKRLKRIIDLLNDGTELFIILDEILKGTNSTDKQKGSFDLIKQFVRLKANGIIATHDLLLGTLAEQFPDHIRNYCFEADIENDELSFSYKLREGVAQNMNACFIMRKMGITID